MNVGATERASVIEAAAGLIEAYFGNSDRARTDVEAALKTSFNRESRRISALALALAGDASEGETVSESLNSEWPLDTIVQHYWMPTVRAAIALDRHTPEKAIEWLQNMGSFELCPVGQMDPVYLRAQAYLEMRNGKAAAREFQKILAHPGLVLENPVGVLARLGMARAYSIQGDTAEARIAYIDFFNQVKDADPDIPILRQARAEYSKLQ